MAQAGPAQGQRVQFCRSADGARLAYAVHGTGPPLVVSTCWLSHLEHDLQSPVWRHWITELGRVATVIRYDERGHGMSDREVPDFALDSRVGDLEAVVDHAGLERFALLGMAQGGPVAIAYTARHPEKVTRLALHGASVATVGATAEERELEDTYLRMLAVGWARPEGRFRRVFTDMLIPGATAEQMAWVDELMRTSTSTENVIAFRLARRDVDVSALLPLLDVPTLVLQARGDQMNPMKESRRLASEIPGAQLVTLESDNHILLADEPAWPAFVAEIVAFLEPDRGGAAPDPDAASRRGGSAPAPDAASRRGADAGDALRDAPARLLRDGARELSRLSGREREVLRLAAAGLDNRDIAAKLTLSVRTVERHLQTVYRKLDLTGSAQRTAAAAIALGAEEYA